MAKDSWLVRARRTGAETTIRLTTKAKGTGLGMAVARRIFEAHGGRIAVGDGDGPGAVFLITPPRERQ